VKSYPWHPWVQGWAQLWLVLSCHWSSNGCREGIVLLENKEDFLPLNSGSIKKIAVIGRNANGEPPSGAGSAAVPAATPPNFVSENRRH
jgi:hypothetical protein